MGWVGVGGRKAGLASQAPACKKKKHVPPGQVLSTNNSLVRKNVSQSRSPDFSSHHHPRRGTRGVCGGATASSVGAGDPSAVIFFFCALSRFRWRFWADPARFIEKRERASLRLTFTLPPFVQPNQGNDIVQPMSGLPGSRALFSCLSSRKVPHFLPWRCLIRGVQFPLRRRGRVTRALSFFSIRLAISPFPPSTRDYVKIAGRWVSSPSSRPGEIWRACLVWPDDQKVMHHIPFVFKL